MNSKKKKKHAIRSDALYKSNETDHALSDIKDDLTCDEVPAVVEYSWHYHMLQVLMSGCTSFKK